MFSAVNRKIETTSGLFVIERDPQPEQPQLTPEVAQCEARRAVSLTVANETEYTAVSAELVRLKSLIKRAREIFDPICQKADEAHKEACRQRRDVVEPLEQACKELEPKVAGYLLQLRREEEERRLQALREAEAIAAAAREAEIEHAETYGAAPEEVASLCERPLDVFPTFAPRPSGRGPVSVRDNYKGVVTDKLALIQHVAKHPEHQHLLDVNATAINQLARALKTALRIPGVQVVNEVGTSTRTAPPRGARS